MTQADFETINEARVRLACMLGTKFGATSTNMTAEEFQAKIEHVCTDLLGMKYIDLAIAAQRELMQADVITAVLMSACDPDMLPKMATNMANYAVLGAVMRKMREERIRAEVSLN